MEDAFAFEIANELMAAIEQNPHATVQIEVARGLYYKIDLARYAEDRDRIMRDSRRMADHALAERGVPEGGLEA